jgi:hypothetical protein
MINNNINHRVDAPICQVLYIPRYHYPSFLCNERYINFNQKISDYPSGKFESESKMRLSDFKAGAFLNTKITNHFDIYAPLSHIVNCI